MNTLFKFMTMSILSLNILGSLGLYPHLMGHEADMTPYLIKLASWSSAIGVLLAIAMVIILMLFNRYAKGNKMNVPGKVLTTSFVLVWLAGFVVYDVGMYISGSPLSLFANLPMAIVHAFEMFLLESDVAAIHAEFHDNWIFMGAFSLTHLLAAVITLIFVLKHFGFNIIAGFRMLFEAYLLGKKSETFVFWGLNDASYLMARSIRDHFKGHSKKDYRIIVVRTHNDGQATSVKNGMERLFNFLSLNNNELELLRELDCLTTSTYSDLINLSIGETDENGNCDILRRHLNLNQLARIIRCKTSGKVHLFFLKDVDDDNIQAVGNLKRDLTIINGANAGVINIFYCKARYNSVHRVIEDELTHDKVIVKVVDPSHISVEILKQDKSLHPVSFVDIEPDATVSSDFNALVVGFGEVGYDAVRFLYEFGAFVRSGSDDVHVERSGFHCDVIDKDIKRLAGLFAVNAPAVSHKMKYNDDKGTDEAPITLHDMDIHSVQFYDYIEQIIGSLNYVVIALNDDEQNVSLAVRIFRLAMRYRKDMNHFRILARVRRDDGNHLLRLSEHYNRLWAAECNSDILSKHLHQRVVKVANEYLEPITLFGTLTMTYTWENIVSDRLKTEAIKFKEKYDQSIIAMNTKATPLDWEAERRDLMQLTDEYMGFSPTYSGIMRLRRIQRQNMENCFHQFTKLLLANTALGPEKIALLKHLSRKENEIVYQWNQHAPDDSVTRVLQVLAQTEHLRWVASHEILGYRDDNSEEDKDEARLLHGCLKPWNQLSTWVQSYDYNVVDVSLGILYC